MSFCWTFGCFIWLLSLTHRRRVTHICVIILWQGNSHKEIYVDPTESWSWSVTKLPSVRHGIWSDTSGSRGHVTLRKNSKPSKTMLPTSWLPTIDAPQAYRASSSSNNPLRNKSTAIMTYKILKDVVYVPPGFINPLPLPAQPLAPQPSSSSLISGQTYTK